MTDVTVEAPKVETPATPETPPNQGAVSGGDNGAILNTEEKAITPDFPDDWRDKFANGDEKERARLDRFKSPVDVYKSARELEKKLSSGKLVTNLPKDASPELVAQWRKENGIPETPEGYKLSEDLSKAFGEADKPMVSKFVADMHAANASPEMVEKALSSYQAMVKENQKLVEDFDAQSKIECEVALRQQLGSDYKPFANGLTNFLASQPKEFADVMSARLPDGTLVKNNPAFLRAIGSLAETINPTISITPSDGQTVSQSVDARMGEIKKMMGDPSSAYYKGDSAKSLQEEYGRLMKLKKV